MAVSSVNGEVTPRSAHVSDPILRPFLQPEFDPADYLNATLPSLSLVSTSSRSSKQATAVSLADLSSQTQTLLSQLNSHTARLSTILTQLTDDILRSGGRLAYEVELLRGETIGLSDSLTDDLQNDIVKFLPGGVTLGSKESDKAISPALDGSIRKDAVVRETIDDVGLPKTESDITLPPHISHLRTLTLVRARLDSVIKVFGEAMQWSLPPSEVSLASSLISVSAPEPGSDHNSREEKGREFAEKLRGEISDLIIGSEGDEAGSEAAMSRIQALRDLAQVWKGTAEEKARIKFVDGLVKLAEERQKALDSASQRQRGGRNGIAQKQTREKTHGFLENLQRMRGNIYLE
ncbi:hypothetical protein K432DRAFT_139367 [Lepidopterella palustris CBS 459.81]|uniref:Uncharacterized protein n=1 Tax=Lepidopterella palustris CBS 459.81 TaxID=1314670 RepID=A0A8E2JBS9_9PEZI|nr:hypothetical protein K432DRAFT_139367 [Lepidopterella palustris CBS 459.81]